MNEARVDEFLESVDFKALATIVAAKIGAPVSFKATVQKARQKRYFSLESHFDYAGSCGVMSCTFKSVKVQSFNSSYHYDPETDNFTYWITIHFQYDHTFGGSNGSRIGEYLFDKGYWVELNR